MTRTDPFRQGAGASATPSGSHPSGHAASGVDGAPRFDPSRYTDSQMVPDTVVGLLGEIARIANDYDLRERIEEHEGFESSVMFDSFMWRDCIELAHAIATEARRAETENTGSVHEGAAPKGIAQ